uniref:Calpain catalytic domain-containing protein n=1 Tax=Syphacia muris TaxID=451379 RepID=A0A0N5AK25_9BILA
MAEEEQVQKVNVSQDEFSGLLGGLAGQFLENQIGGDAGHLIGSLVRGGSDRGNSGWELASTGFDIGSTIGNAIGGEKGGAIGGVLGELIGSSRDKRDSNYGGNDSGNGGGNGLGDMLGDILSGGRSSQRSGANGIGDVIGSLLGGGGSGERDSRNAEPAPSSGSNIGNLITDILAGGGGIRNGRYGGGGGILFYYFFYYLSEFILLGENVPVDMLRGGVIEILSNLFGQAAHRFLGIDPETGRIIGAVAGNVIFDCSGKDNKLSNIGKIILDNIISGKGRRNVKPYIPREPKVIRGPEPEPTPTAQAVDFYDKRDECLQSGTLYEDPDFPADNSSLYYSRSPPKYIQWLRPCEITHEPTLIQEGQSRFDVIQGELGDCWLMAAAANLTLRDELFYRVVPPDQSFTDNYAGIFHFQFWHYGEWTDVVIDDRLPTEDGRLLYMHSRENNAFWSALLEKAYAKLHGSYEALKGGTTSEALVDMTGGLTEFVDLKKPPKNLLQMMFKGFEMGSLFGCSIEAQPNEFEARTREGLIKGHAYSITGMRMVDVGGEKIPLLRIRNPWGNDQEWNGDWSDSSYLWQQISEEQKRDMNLVLAHDGEFWMSFDDFLHFYDKMEICNLGPDVMNDVESMTGISITNALYKQWNTRTHLGVWDGSTAGGCRNFLESFDRNPQFGMTLSDPDPADEDGLCTVIISVLQKYRREMKWKGLDNMAIGFAIYEVDSIDGHLDRSFFARTSSTARSAAFINLREVTGRFRLHPGSYVIIPSTYDPGERGEFMLRIFTNVTIETE